MKTKPRRKSRDGRARVPRLEPVAEGEHQPSPTAVAAEMLRTGVPPGRTLHRHESIPHEGDAIRVGDPDDDAMGNEYVGEEVPGGSSPTPDQNSVDDIGRAYGLQEEDSGVLRSAAEVLDRRDKHRSELQPPGKPQV